MLLPVPATVQDAAVIAKAAALMTQNKYQTYGKRKQ